MERTLIQLFTQSVDAFPENPLIWEKREGQYHPTTYRDAFEPVRELSAGLMDMGLEKGDRVMLLSEGRNEWVFSELGILFAGGINVPVSVKLLEPSEVEFRLKHSDSKFIIVSGRHFERIKTIAKNASCVQKIIVMDKVEIKEKNVIYIEDVRAQGRALLQKKPQILENRLASIKEQDPANICYTSGTTADPKGIVLTHRNYTANIEQAQAIYDIPQKYVSLLILPWDHSFAHTCGIYTLMSSGASMASVEVGATMIETTKNIGKNIKEIRPHFLMSVPALSDSFKKTIEKGIGQKGALVGRLFKTGLSVAAKYQGRGKYNGRWHGNPLFGPLYGFFNLLVFSKIRKEFGGRLEFFVGGGALLDIGYQRFFTALGIPVYQGYGLTEAAPVISANCPGSQKMGTSGRLVPNLEIKICDENGKNLPEGKPGEIVVRGDNVMKEYWRNPEATRKTVRDGWLYTGDMGYMDKEGFLMVLGRFKSLLISDDGEKFSPEGIEESLVNRCPFIRQIMLVNNQNPYTSALIVPNTSSVLRKLRENGLSPSTPEGRKTALALYVDAIRTFQTNPSLKSEFPGKWLPSAFAVLDEAFTEANRFLNSTLKMVRWRISEHYKDRIAFMYTGEGKDPFNRLNEQAIGRIKDES
jgi:long-chain acyl-CoA synthetase